MPFSTSTEVSLYYNVAGQGPALCLVNGYRLSSGAWPNAFLERLRTRCTVIAFDNRGTGRSAKPAKGYEISDMANDVIGLMNELRLPQAYLFGFSMGGAIAQDVAIRFPDRISKLILFGTFCGGIWAEPASFAVFKSLLSSDDQTPEEAARRAWPATYGAEYLAANRAAVERQLEREMEYPTPTFVAKRQMEGLRNFDRYWDLKHIRAETLVATGTADVLVKPRNSSIIASRIPGARLEMLADLGHRAVWESPEEIADLVGDFLTGPAAWCPPLRETGCSGELTG